MTKKKRKQIEAEERGWRYDLPPTLILVLDDYLAGRGDERRCSDALSKLTPNQAESVRTYAADRAAEGIEAAEHLAGMLTSLGTGTAAGRARIRPSAES